MYNQRNLLASLYAATENEDDQENVIISKGRFSHLNVCKDFLVGACPASMFDNTEYDILKRCTKIHSDELKSLYNEAKKYKSYGYEQHFLDNARVVINRANKNIENNKLKREDDGNVKVPQSVLEDVEVVALSQRVTLMMDEVNSSFMQPDNDVSKIYSLMKQLEDLEAQRQSLINTKAGLNEDGRSSGAVRQFLKVCPVCASLLSDTAHQLRLFEHYKGKLHKGMHLLRQTVSEVQAWLDSPDYPTLRAEDALDIDDMDSRRERLGGGDGRRGGRGNRGGFRGGSDPRGRGGRFGGDSRGGRGRDGREDNFRDTRNRGEERDNRWDARDDRQPQSNRDIVKDSWRGRGSSPATGYKDYNREGDFDDGFSRRVRSRSQSNPRRRSRSPRSPARNSTHNRDFDNPREIRERDRDRSYSPYADRKRHRDRRYDERDGRRLRGFSPREYSPYRKREDNFQNYESSSGLQNNEHSTSRGRTDVKEDNLWRGKDMNSSNNLDGDTTTHLLKQTPENPSAPVTTFAGVYDDLF